MKPILLLLVFSGFVGLAEAQPGTLDTSFGAEGRSVSTSFFGTPASLKIQTNGKIVMVGQGSLIANINNRWLVVRYNADGSLDNEFGDSGKVFTSGEEFGASFSNGSAVTIQNDGKIIVGGGFNFAETSIDVGLVRYNYDGSIDTGFGNKGFVFTDFGLSDYCGNITLQKDGKIIMIGTNKNFVNGNTFSFIARYLTDGSLDESFGKHGIIYDGFKNFVYLYPITIQEDGKIIAAGIEDEVTNNYLVTRYLTDGTRDKSYGDNGIARMFFPDHTWEYTFISGIVLQQDGKLIVTGHSGKDKGLITVARFDSTGKIDSSFATNGIYVTQDTKYSSTGKLPFIQENKKLLITGVINDGINSFMAMQFNANGIVDSSFGNNGIAGTDVPEKNSGGGICGALQKDGKIVIGGVLNRGDISNFALTRFNGDPVNQHSRITRIRKWIKNHILNFEDNNPNAAYYVIEQSNNATTGFTPIATIQRNAISNNYSYAIPQSTTNNHKQATNHYRIKLINKDGTVIYTDAMADESFTIQNSTFKIFPNPAKNTITIQSAKAVTVRLKNSNGLVLATQKINGSGSMDISKLHSGVYYVVDVETRTSYKVVKE